MPAQCDDSPEIEIMGDDRTFFILRLGDNPIVWKTFQPLLTQVNDIVAF